MGEAFHNSPEQWNRIMHKSEVSARVPRRYAHRQISNAIRSTNTLGSSPNLIGSNYANNGDSDISPDLPVIDESIFDTLGTAEFRTQMTMPLRIDLHSPLASKSLPLADLTDLLPRLSLQPFTFFARDHLAGTAKR
jgi:hypothetical protein